MWRLVPRSAWHGGVRSLFGFDELGGLFQPNLFSVQRAQWKFMLLGDPYTGVKPFQEKKTTKKPLFIRMKVAGHHRAFRSQCRL